MRGQWAYGQSPLSQPQPSLARRRGARGGAFPLSHCLHVGHQPLVTVTPAAHGVTSVTGIVTVHSGLRWFLLLKAVDAATDVH